jgi:hypothetical protein
MGQLELQRDPVPTRTGTGFPGFFEKTGTGNPVPVDLTIPGPGFASPAGTGTNREKNTPLKIGFSTPNAHKIWIYF